MFFSRQNLKMRGVAACLVPAYVMNVLAFDIAVKQFSHEAMSQYLSLPLAGGQVHVTDWVRLAEPGPALV